MFLCQLCTIIIYRKATFSSALNLISLIAIEQMDAPIV